MRKLKAKIAFYVLRYYYNNAIVAEAKCDLAKVRRDRAWDKLLLRCRQLSTWGLGQKSDRKRGENE